MGWFAKPTGFQIIVIIGYRKIKKLDFVFKKHPLKFTDIKLVKSVRFVSDQSKFNVDEQHKRLKLTIMR